MVSLELPQNEFWEWGGVELVEVNEWISRDSAMTVDLVSLIKNVDQSQLHLLSSTSLPITDLLMHLRRHRSTPFPPYLELEDEAGFFI